MFCVSIGKKILGNCGSSSKWMKVCMIHTMLLSAHTSVIYSSGTRPLLTEDMKGNFKENNTCHTVCAVWNLI
jgi:hypothetical protein